MPGSKGPLALSLLIITLGTGWLLSAIGFGPNLNWIWILGLGMLGVLTFIGTGGVDKASIVIGPFFLFSSGLSMMRQSGHLSIDIEIPILIILIGVLLLIAQSRMIPAPTWFVPLEPPRHNED